MDSLNRVREYVENWCGSNNIYTSAVIDNHGIQGIKIFEKRDKLSDLFSYLSGLSNICFDVQKARGGVVLALSVKAISETDMFGLLNQIEEEQAMSLRDRLDRAFYESPRDVKPEPTPKPDISEQVYDFDSKAIEIAEDQYKSATAGITRSNQSSRQRNLHTVTMTHGGVVDGKRHNRTSSKKKGKKTFDRALREYLEGMATPTDAQPEDLFKKFANALKMVGQNIGIGPLQDRLNEQGIKWRRSQDGQSIIMYVVNAQTNAPQPIARITADTLSKPHDFETQLLNMVDFSEGNAPGAFKQRQEELREREKIVRDIARAANPENPEQNASQEFQNGMKTPEIQRSVTPQPPNQEQVAATKAATPKA